MWPRLTYATLTVSLIHSLTFQRKELYKNAALFRATQDKVCGFAVEYPDQYNDAHGRLTVFFDDDVDKDMRLLFLRYVDRQLEKLALAGTVTRERIYQCLDCGYQIPQEIVNAWKDRGDLAVMCPMHPGHRHITLDDLIEELQVDDERVAQIEAASDEERERQERRVVVAEREALKQFHTFLSYTHFRHDFEIPTLIY